MSFPLRVKKPGQVLPRAFVCGVHREKRAIERFRARGIAGERKQIRLDEHGRRTVGDQTAQNEHTGQGRASGGAGCWAFRHAVAAAGRALPSSPEGLPRACFFKTGPNRRVIKIETQRVRGGGRVVASTGPLQLLRPAAPNNRGPRVEANRRLKKKVLFVLPRQTVEQWVFQDARGGFGLGRIDQ